MKNNVTRTLIGMLIAALLAFPTIAQNTPQESNVDKEAAKEAKKLAERQRKEAAELDREEAKLAEKRKKEAEKLAKEAEKNKPKKPNSDIDNIGNRNINGGLNLLTPDLEKEIAMGRQAARELEQTVVLLKDPTVTEYVNRIGQNIVRNSDAQVPFTIKVIESDEINAVSLPGGFFYVNSGLIQAADEEAELAGVMAHEIAHVTARHAAEQMGKSRLLDFATLPLIFVGGGIVGTAIQSAASIGIPVGLIAFGRKDEGEADWLGLQYMYKAGYDPGASVSFFEKLQARDSAKQRRVGGLFQTHPATEDRVAETKKNIENFLPPREQYLVTTSEFQKIKGILARLEEQRVPVERDRGPSLRRRAPSQRTPRDGDDPRGPQAPDGVEEPDSDDGPPVLRRPQDAPQ